MVYRKCPHLQCPVHPCTSTTQPALPQVSWVQHTRSGRFIPHQMAPSVRYQLSTCPTFSGGIDSPFANSRVHLTSTHQLSLSPLQKPVTSWSQGRGSQVSLRVSSNAAVLYDACVPYGSPLRVFGGQMLPNPPLLHEHFNERWPTSEVTALHIHMLPQGATLTCLSYPAIPSGCPNGYQVFQASPQTPVASRQPQQPTRWSMVIPFRASPRQDSNRTPQ